MQLGIEGYEARCTVTAPGHWLVRGASRFGGPIICRARALSEKEADCDLIFVGVEDEGKVSSFLRRHGNVRVRQVGRKSPGVVVDTLCKRIGLERKITKRDTSVSLIASPEGTIEIIVRSPWKSDFDELTEIDKLPKIKLKGAVETKEVTIPVEIGGLQEEVTEKLGETARALIDSGYYDLKRPKGLTHVVLAKKLGISKPTLERRMRELESLGISSLLSAESKLSKEDLKASWDAFVRSSAKKE